MPYDTGRSGFSGGSAGKKKKKKSTSNAGDVASIPGSGRFPGEFPANTSILAWEIPWQATVHGIARVRRQQPEAQLSAL